MSKHYLALDIGGTKIYGALYNKEMTVLAEMKIPTESAQGKSAVLNNIIKIVQKLKTSETLSIGIAWAGFVDSKNGIIKQAPNIEGFLDFPLCDHIQKETGIPTFIGNDARLFAYGESLSSPTPPIALLGIIIGTGVGGGLVINGDIFYGAHNFAGEVGHCTDGEDEIETLIAGPGITTYLQNYFEIQQLSDLDNHDFSSKEMREIIQPRIKILTRWLRNLCLALDPSEIVIGGGAGLYFWQHFEKEINIELEHLLSQYPTTLKIRYSSLKNAGNLGAGYLAINSLRS